MLDLTNPGPRLAFFGLLTLMAGCRPRAGRADTEPRLLMHTSFEDLVGWAPEVAATLSTEKAHTGRFSLRVDPQHPYSSTYRVELGELCDRRPRRLTISAWVWVPSFQDNAMLVAAISQPGDPDHPILHKYVYLTDDNSFKKWKHVSRDIDMPYDVYSKTQLTLYLWNSSSTAPVYADDLEVTELK